MAYINDLNQLQLGKEVTWGTAVAGTAKMGLIESAEMNAEIEVGQSADVRGSLVGSDYVHTLNSQKASAKVSGIATYEDIGYWLDSLLAINASPTGVGPYVYTRNAPLTAAPTRRMMTMIWGQTGAIYKLAGGLVQDFTLSIESNKPWKFDAGIVGKSVATGALAALSDRTQTPIHANVSTLYIDAVGGTIGTTAITTSWFSAELSVKSNVDVVPGIGNLNPVTYRDAAYEATLKMTLEVDATSAGYVSSIIGSSLLQHQVRIKATTGASAVAQFDFAGSHTKAPTMVSDSDGVITFEFEMTKSYNTTLANWLMTSITNSVATLP